jgi:hypothetical protein
MSEIAVPRRRGFCESSELSMAVCSINIAKSKSRSLMLFVPAQ